MKLLLKKLKNNSTDVRVLLDIENYIKKKWKIFSGEREFNYLVFSDAFSQLLLKLENNELKSEKDILNYFSNIYKSNYDKLSSHLQKHEGGETVETIKKSKMNFDELDNNEFLILYKYLNDKIINNNVNRILAKLEYSSGASDKDFIKKLTSSNYVTMYLSSQLGHKKFMDFCELVNSLGIYYPMINIPDTEVSVKLKEGILKKFIDAIDSDNVDNLQKLEEFLFKN